MAYSNNRDSELTVQGATEKLVGFLYGLGKEGRESLNLDKWENEAARGTPTHKLAILVANLVEEVMQEEGDYPEDEEGEEPSIDGEE